MKITKFSILALLAVTGFNSCSSEAEVKEETTSEKVEEVIVENVVEEDADLNKELQFKIDLIIGNNISGPSKIIADIKSQGLGRFIDGTAVNLEETNLDGTSISKGLLLGALGVDVTYLSIYERPDLSIKYLAVINKLDQALDCGMQINSETIDQFEAVKEDGEAISNLMYDQYFKMEGYLRSNSRLETAAHVMVGGTVESMFIATSQLSEADELTPEAVDVVYAQKQAITDLISVFLELEKTDGNETVLEELTAIQVVLEKMSTDFSKEDLKELHGIVEAFHLEIAEAGIM